MPWSERYALGVAEMDATHQEFVAASEALLAASDADFPALLAQIEAHTRRHFENEDALMRAHRFSAIGEHTADHQRVLGELAHFRRAAANGRIALARAYVRSLPTWFEAHLATMDSALAACIRQKAEA